MQTLTVHQNFEFLKTVLQSSSHPKYPEGSQLKRACVFLLMKNTENREILTILKSDNPGYAWRNQIALPGGHVDRTDDSPLDTAFRELEEELGIKPENVRFVGNLGHFPTINNRDIQVFAGIWNGEDEIIFDEQEISQYFEVPLNQLIESHIENDYAGNVPSIYDLKYPVESHVIWGATARIFHHFLELVISCSD